MTAISVAVMWSHFSFGQREAIDAIKAKIDSIENRENFTPDKPYIDLINQLGELYYNIDPDSTFVLGMKSLEASERAKYTEGVVDAYRNIGAYHNLRGEYDQAMGYFEEGLQLSGEVQYWQGMANIYNSMGLNYYDRGLLEESVTVYLQALEIKEQHLSESEQSKTLSNLGLVFLDLGDFEKALRYHNRALEIRKATQNVPGIAYSMANIGEVYKDNGDLEKSLQNYQASLKIGEEIDNRQLVSVCHFNIGDIYLKQGIFEEALFHFETALNLDRERNDKVGISYDLLGVGEAQMKLGNTTAAKKAIEQGLDVALESNLKDEVQKAHLLLSELYEKESNLSKALYHYKIHKTYQDSILNQGTKIEIQKLTTEYALAKREAEFLQAQRESELRNEAKMEQRLRTGVTIILVILLIAFFIALRSAKSQIKAREVVTRQKNELEKLNKKILLQKNEIEKVANQMFEVNQTKDKLFSIVGHDLKSPINSLKGLMQYVVDEKLTQEEFLLVSAQLRNEVEQVHFTLINLLHWAKGQMKGIVTDTEKVSINKILKEITSLYKPVSEAKDITIRDNLEPHTDCLVDREQCNLIMRNLLNNALKFTNRGGNISISSKKVDDSYWEISIQDDGIGIDSQTLTKLFTPALKEKHRYGTAGEKGTGLGLQLTKDFVKINGGDIHVKSELGKGSTFTFTLPIA
ncbi:ATP-binding protein [Cyclobacterium jeungdonense]|uniref:histidine kinase n=1 Tax=Cyclobacterium jeungdonense TaxID=708087 RepID=A0ABT8C828_9BACT|nr:tetratricopeptide repeat protein [Cyclobacterium jeungdonense]MDN3688943.1 tetratricopeptide repeat-containing sensor histidine kinase [Cyclobacterium jeungdonense]